MNSTRWQELQEVFATAIDLPEQEQQVYLARACDGHPELRAEVDGLLRAHCQAGSFIEPVPDRVGPYRLLEQIGRGGMGVVYRAERVDGQFEQHVAVKLLSFAGSAAMQRRFSDERQILANLSHPNMARLLDGGVTPSGAPYIVMEYVDGVPIDQYCQGRPLSERLRLFRTVCAAVHYAHQNLVVHRDLKPANILVAADGEPKLLDFGIAKILTPDRESGVTLVPAVTIEYGSPEQLRGGPISTVSDVYSLGVVLHGLSTGRRPYDVAGKTYDEVLRTVCEQPIGKPGAGSADLDAVILKALRKEPEERYPSAEALSADIGRYLAKRPVEAHRGAAWYVLTKFLARHRAAVATACAVALLLTLAVAVTVRQSRIATRRFDYVRQLASSVVYQIHDAIAALPGSTPARKLIVSNALEYLDKLSRDAAGDHALQIELADAYLRLGDVQGLQSQSNLGDPYGAIDSYRRSQGLFKSARQGRSEDPRVTIGLANACWHLGLVLLHVRRTDEARAAVAEALPLLEDLARRSPNDANRQHLAVGYSAMADVLDNDLDYRYKVLAIWEDLWKAEPQDLRRQRAVALSHKNIAGILLPRTYGDRALPHLRRAEELDGLRAAADPRSTQAQMDLSFDYSQNGTFYLNREQYAEALREYQKALAIRRRLAALDQADARLQDRLVYAHQRVGDASEYLKRHTGALHAYREAVRISQKLFTGQPKLPAYRLHLANSLAGEARAEWALGRKREACAAWRGASVPFQEMDRDGQLRPKERADFQELERRLAACK